MTDLGLAFDDDDLDTHKKKHNKAKDLPYHVKIVTPKWFDQAGTKTGCAAEDYQVLKFSGDYRYRLKDYVAAAEKYKTALSILPENNVFVSQDLRESLARCHACLGNFTKGLKISRDLVKEMSAEDEARQRQSLMLHAFICEKAHLWEECVQCLQRLCLLQPDFPQTWCQLGDAIVNLIKHRGHASEHNQHDFDDTCGVAKSSTENCCQTGKHKDSEIPLCLSLVCYTRARLLFESVLGNASNIIKVRNQRLIAEMTEKIRNLSLSEELKQRACENVPRNIESQVGYLLKSLMEDYKEESSGEDAEHDKVFQHGDISDLFYQCFCI